MLLPHPESDLRLNILVLGSEIIKLLKSKSKGLNYVLIENVLNEFLKGDNRRTPDLFVYTLLFLYSIGIIEQKGYKIKLVTEFHTQPTLFDSNT